MNTFTEQVDTLEEQVAGLGMGAKAKMKEQLARVALDRDQLKVDLDARKASREAREMLLE